MDDINIHDSWNKRRIIMAVVLAIGLIIGGYVLKTKIFDNKTFSDDLSMSVKGTSSEKQENKLQKENLNLNVQKALVEKLQNLKQEVTGLNIAEIASASAQVQKILNDIKSLEQYPVNQAKEICRQICGL